MNTVGDLKKKALSLGASEFGPSDKENKRFYVIYDGEKIHFGADGAVTYYDYKDNKMRNAWKARHSKIRNKAGKYVIELKSSPSYWSSNLLW